MRIKAAGADLFTPQDREVRAGCRQAGRIVLAESLAADRAAQAAQGATEIAALKEAGIAGLDRAEYEKAKRGALRSLRKIP